MKQLVIAWNDGTIKDLHSWTSLDRFVTAVYARYSFQIVNKFLRQTTDEISS
jgi:hypothetical protein